MPTFLHCSFKVLALILPYGGHCFLVRLLSKVMHGFPHHCPVRLPASLNNVPQHMMFPDSIITILINSVYLIVVTGNQWSVSVNGVFWHDPFSTQIKIKSSLVTFLRYSCIQYS